MPTEEKSKMDLLEECEKESYSNYLKLGPDDPNKAKMANICKTFAEISQTYDVNEQNRLNNYAKNEQAERQTEIEIGKLENDKRRTRADYCKAGMMLFGSLVTGIGGYFLEPYLSQWKPWQRASDRFGDLISRK